MAKLSEQELRKEISSGNLKTLYVIYGDEKYLVKKYTQAVIRKAVGKEPSGFDYFQLSSETPLEEIFDASQQIAVFSERKCVNVTDYDINSLSESDMKELEKFLPEISPTTVLIFSMPTLDTSSRKKKDTKGKTKFTKFLAAAEKYGSVIQLDKIGDIALEAQLIKWAEKNGAKLGKINASKIIALIGTDMNSLKNEVDKLSAYVKDGEITAETIELLCVKNSETKAYNLSKYITKNDYNSTYKELDILFGQNERPEIILGGISSAFVDIYRAKAAMESGKSIPAAAKELKYGSREFVLKNASYTAAKYSSETLKAILDAILEADIKMKSTRSDARILIETLVARILLIIKEDR